MRETFRGLVVVSTAIYIIYYFLPYFDWRWHSPETMDLLVLSGYGAKITLPTVVVHSLFALWLLSALGLYFFKPIARSAFVWLYVITTVVEPFGGVVIQTGIDVTLRSITTLLDGAIIAMAYLTTVERLFVLDSAEIA